MLVVIGQADTGTNLNTISKKNAFCASICFLQILLSQETHAQSLPTFDEDDFQIISIETGAEAIVRSDDHDFLCALMQNAKNGYILVHSCLPFIPLGQAEGVDAAAAELAAETFAVQQEQLKTVADEANSQQKELSIGFTVQQFSSALEELAKLNGCEVRMGKNKFAAAEDFAPLLNQVGATAELTSEQATELHKMALDAVAALYRQDRIEYVEQSTKIRFKECN